VWHSSARITRSYGPSMKAKRPSTQADSLLGLGIVARSMPRFGRLALIGEVVVEAFLRAVIDTRRANTRLVPAPGRDR